MEASASTRIIRKRFSPERSAAGTAATIFHRSIDGGRAGRPLEQRSVRDSSAAPWLRWGKDEAPFGHWIGDVEIDPIDSDREIYVTGWGVWMTNELTNADNDQPTHWIFTQGIEECVVNNVISPPTGAHLLSVMWDIDGFRHENLDVSPPQGFFRPQVGRNTDIILPRRIRT